MNLKLISLSLLATLASGASLAQTNNTSIFNKIDQNKDHFITLDELKTYQKTNFQHEADTNNDNNISLKEAKDAGADLNAFHKADTNHDNILSFDESFIEEKSAFEKDDTNHDGKISESEFQAHTD